jgi:PIN domain-containing protein
MPVVPPVRPAVTRLRVAFWTRATGRWYYPCPSREVPVFRMLIDTCVWLDLAKDEKQHPVLGVVEEMVRRNMLALIVPRLAIDEFRRNRARVAKESAKSLASHFTVVKNALSRVGGDKRRMRTVLSHLDDVNHKIPIIGGSAVSVLDRIEKLLTATPPIEPRDPVKVRAAQRAIDRKAPFHRNRNSMADALLMETYAESTRAKETTGDRFAFVTHNTADFSMIVGNQKLAHADFSDVFSRVKSRYYISLPEALRRVDPSLVTETMFEYSWTQEPRGLAEMLKAEKLLFNQVWYNRHWNMRALIKNGTIKVVRKQTFPPPLGAPETITPGVLKMAKKAARKVERLYGKENLGPWDDFEWGMINGKLSALRWVLGDEWDMLDT